MKFPEGFFQLTFPGYFWHPESHQLFSIKSGVLKPLKLQKWRHEFRYGHGRLVKEFNYSISHQGKAITLPIKDLVNNMHISDKQEILIAPCQ
jgi:hypothetical protein